MNAGPNQVELVVVQPNQLFIREYQCELSANDLYIESLKTDGTKAGYLRESTLIDFSESVRTFAVESHRDTAYETYRALYNTVVTKSTYSWPPQDRGASSFLRTFAGDCGEMSFAIVAGCRYLGINARVAIGAFAKAGLKAHSWLEVFIDGRWVVSDPALGNAEKQNARKWFDFTPIDRLVFSYDCDLHVDGLREAQGDSHMYVTMGGKKFSWGSSFLNGMVPYLQPGYPLVDEDMLAPMNIPIWDIS